jgi:hypothetical protein
MNTKKNTLNQSFKRILTLKDYNNKVQERRLSIGDMYRIDSTDRQLIYKNML